MLPPLKRIDKMKVMNVVDFHRNAPRNATHVLKMGDKYEYANLARGSYDSCDNATRDDMLRNPSAGNNDSFFLVRYDYWQVHLTL